MALRRYLIILAALTILPLVGFTTWIALEVHREDRAREVTAMVSSLESLATSTDLDTGNLKGFYDSYIAKPVEPDELAAVIGRLVTRARALRPRQEKP